MSGDWDLDFKPLEIIGGANLADEEELQAAIDSLNRLIGTGYYDDGDEILIPVVQYLTKQLNRGK